MVFDLEPLGQAIYSVSVMIIAAIGLFFIVRMYTLTDAKMLAKEVARAARDQVRYVRRRLVE